MTVPEILEPHVEWRSHDVADPESWTEHLSAEEIAEIGAAMDHARGISDDLLEIGKEQFPLPVLGPRLERISRDLIDGRGFVLIRGLPRADYSNDDMCLAYWGLGMHLGRPWPQNRHGHVLGDVTDQGRRADDATSRGNEIGGIAFPYHSDGSDLVGLMCLQTAREGGLSTVCNAVAIHNDLIRMRPDLVEELYKPQPYDFRGEEAKNAKPWYEMPVFTNWHGRLFVRYIRPYILASQRHEGAPRITDKAEEAMVLLDQMTGDGQYTVYMDFQPGDMQFINNYHVLHARTAYVDDRAGGLVRHLKRLWLETDALADRPPWFRNHVSEHWARDKKLSRLDAAE